MNLEADLRSALADNAEGPPRPAPDIEALLARGERYRRRRGAARLGGVAAVLSFVLAATTSIDLDLGAERRPPAAGGGPTAKLPSAQPDVRPTVPDSASVETIPVGEALGAIALDSTRDLAYVTRSGDGTPEDGTVSVIDTRTRQVVDTIPVGTRLFGVAVADNALYLADGTSAVTVVDTWSRKVTGTITIGKGKWPVGLAVDDGANALYVANNGDATVSVVDLATRQITDSIRVGRSPRGVLLDPEAGVLYVDNGNGPSVSVIDTATRTVRHTITGVTGAMAIDSPGNTLWMTRDDNSVSVFDATTYRTLRTIRVGQRPGGVGVDPSTGRAYIANGRDNDVSVVDTATRREIGRVPVGSWPGSLHVEPTSGVVYVVGEGTVSMFDTD
jgi:YVTN family beta-propeller protein